MRRIIFAALAVLLVGNALAAAQVFGPDDFKARRAALAEQLDGAVALIYGADESNAIVKGNFVQESTFYYLTGVSEPGAALILAPGARPYPETLYLPNRDPEREDWEGRRDPIGDALNEKLGFARVSRSNRLSRDLTAMLQNSKKAVFLGPVVGATTPIPKALQMLRDAQARVPGSSLENMADVVPEMRRIKSVAEIELIRNAVHTTGKGIMAAMQAVQPGMKEFQLQSVLEHAYEMDGSQLLGFGTILAWGPNATVLHYGTNNGAIGDSGLVLIDTGTAWEHYTADITRTFPVNGKFTEREREIYELVLNAADTAIANLKPGADHHNDMHLAAKKYLEDAGYGKYFIHGAGHFVGLDVHDVGDYSLPLKEGVVLTVEPGIYIPEEGIGVRIEDVVLITADGAEVMSRHIPRTVEEIEAVMAK